MLKHRRWIRAAVNRLHATAIEARIALKRGELLKRRRETATYKSVKDDKVHLLSALIRIGAKDAFVDNAHAGGVLVRIMEDGRLADYCFNQYAERTNEHNGIDFSKHEFRVPDWDKVVDYALRNAANLPHMRLIQHDIILDEEGNPRYIEINCNGFAQWVAQFSGTPAFGDFAAEMRDYALQRRMYTRNLIL